jgi:hypothetical protein
MTGDVFFGGAVWCVLAAFYLLFAGQVSSHEIAAGMVATAPATVFAVLLHRARSRWMRLTAPWLRLVGRPLATLFPDAVRVGLRLARALWRPPDGAGGFVARQPFRHGDAGADDAGRRGMVTLALSVAPNGYVMNVPAGDDAVLMHRLARVAPDPDPEWPA